MLEGKGIFVRFLIFAALIAPALFYFFSGDKTLASEKQSDLIINELYPNQLSDGVDYEWAELLVPADFGDFDIAEYKLFKVTSSGTEYVKQLSATICNAESRYLVCNLGNSWLANSGSTVILRHQDIEIDRVVYGSSATSAPIPGAGQSISRVPDGRDSGDDAADFRIVAISKGAPNPEPAKPPEYSDQVRINEILPRPSTSSNDEFIELINFGEKTVDLSGWTLDDASEGSEFVIPDLTAIASGQYLLFCKNGSDPKCINYHSISLNDGGDTVVLRDPLANIKDRISYGSAPRGEAYALNGGVWSWSLRVTPGQQNVIEVENMVDEDKPLTTSDVITAKTLPDGEDIIISGIITAPPGILSKQYFYLQDESGGIQVYSYYSSFPPLLAGSRIKVQGELATYYGERRLKISASSDIILLGVAAVPPPAAKNISEIVDEDVGTMVSTQGEVSSTSGDTFVIAYDKELKVIIRDETRIDKPRMRRGDRVAVTGVLSSYKGQYRILPISQDGVTILTSGKLPITGQEPLTKELWSLSAKIQPRLLASSMICALVLLAATHYSWLASLAVAKPPRLKPWQNILA